MEVFVLSIVFEETIYCFRELLLWENGLKEIQFGIWPFKGRKLISSERVCLWAHTEGVSLGNGRHVLSLHRPNTCSTLVHRAALRFQIKLCLRANDLHANVRKLGFSKFLHLKKPQKNKTKSLVASSQGSVPEVFVRMKNPCLVFPAFFWGLRLHIWTFYRSHTTGPSAVPSSCC